MRILYGLAGEGLGHAMRSQVVLRHLVDAGHDVRVVTSGRAATVLADRGFQVETIRGLSLEYRRGGVAQTRSVGAFLTGAPSMARHNRRVFLRILQEFDPELCISDFDSFAHAVGRWLDRPVISFDHQHVIDRCHHPRVLRSPSVELARALVTAKLPGCAHYVVTSFFDPPVREDCAANTSLVGPILRPEVAALEARPGGHVLVYQTAYSDAWLMPALEGMPDVEFRVYGIPEQPAGDHIHFRPFSEVGFLEDLATARAVLSNGGYTTLSEALCLGKPVLSVPLKRHGEQQLNASWLQLLGLGLRADVVTPDTIRALLDLPASAPLLSGNAAALEAVDALLAAA